MTIASGVLLPGFAGTELPDWLAARLRTGLAGVCVYGDNVVSVEQIRALTNAIRGANPLALIALDEEGGDVTRLYYAEGSPYPGNAILGRIDDPEYTESIARSVGRQLRSVGVNLDFAPDADINSNPDNPVIGVRSFGADAHLVARHVGAWVRGLESTGVAATPKHFPGHGDTATDSHRALPVVDVELEVLHERELVPFTAAVAAGASAIMSSHILLPQVDAESPATFSSVVLLGVLRDELGFDGVIVSDALDMKGASAVTGIPEAAVRALAAGCDLLCIGTNNTDEELESIEQEILEAVGSKRLEVARLAEAADRTLSLAHSLAEKAAATPSKMSEPQFDLARTAAVFEVTPGVSIQKQRTLVALDTVENIAVGRAPWGTSAVQRIAEGQALADVTGQLILLGKDNHRHAWVRELVDRARAEHDTVVVDMGWPSVDRKYADVATFGASRHGGLALDAWLERAAQ